MAQYENTDYANLNASLLKLITVLSMIEKAAIICLIRIIINDYWMRLSMIARIIEAEVCDKTNRGLENFTIMRKRNPVIIVLLCNCKF